jgi:hypothetical protein
VKTEMAKLTLSPCAALEREAFFTNTSGASFSGGVDVIVGNGEAVGVPANVVEVGTSVAGTAVAPPVAVGTAVAPPVAVGTAVAPPVAVGSGVDVSVGTGVSVERASGCTPAVADGCA